MEDKEFIQVRVQDLRKIRAAVERHSYYQSEQEKKESSSAMLGFLDGWVSGLFSANEL